MRSARTYRDQKKRRAPEGARRCNRQRMSTLLDSAARQLTVVPPTERVPAKVRGAVSWLARMDGAMISRYRSARTPLVAFDRLQLSLASGPSEQVSPFAQTLLTFLPLSMLEHACHCVHTERLPR